LSLSAFEQLQREKDKVRAWTNAVGSLLSYGERQFREETWRGKGGHATIWVGDKVTTLPAREIDPKTAKKIRKALGLD
jgi:hypothetical protein